MRSRLNIIAVGAAILIAAFLATPTLAVELIQVTRGSVFPFAAGLETGYDISGQARMVRSVVGHTTVTLRVQGLLPDTGYVVNVHNQACSNEAGGGHYQHEVGGAVDNINEIWQIITTRSNGYGYSRTVNDFVARSEARSVVIHNANDTSLLVACANLRPIAVSPYTFSTAQIEDLAAFNTNETNVQRSFETEAARYAGLAALYAADDTSPFGSAYYAANPELMVTHRYVLADRSAISRPGSVDIEVLRNDYYNSAAKANARRALEADAARYKGLAASYAADSSSASSQPVSVDIGVLLRNNPNYYHPGR